MYSRTNRVERVVPTRVRIRLKKTERAERELLALLEQPVISEERQRRLSSLLLRFSTDELAEVLRRPSVHEVGPMTLPRRCRLCNSRLDAVDSEDPATFLPVKTFGATESDVERLLVRNASGHGPRLKGAYHG